MSKEKAKRYINSSIEVLNSVNHPRTEDSWVSLQLKYENPNLEECGKQVLDDFSNKILTIFKENLYGMKKRRTHCQIYDEINRRWFRFYESIPITYECKKILKLTNSQDNIGKYVLDYILDYMSHNYLGRNVKEPTLDDINNWCGNGEFPFLEVYLIRNADGVVSLAYYLAR